MSKKNTRHGVDRDKRICGKPPESSYSISEFVLAVLAVIASYMDSLCHKKL